MPEIKETIQKVKSFADLPKGWHYGCGGAINDKIINEAVRLLELAKIHGHARANAFPGEDGCVEITFYMGEIIYAITLNPDNTYDVCIDDNRDNDFILMVFDAPYDKVELLINAILLTYSDLDHLPTS